MKKRKLDAYRYYTRRYLLRKFWLKLCKGVGYILLIPALPFVLLNEYMERLDRNTYRSMHPYTGGTYSQMIRCRKCKYAEGEPAYVNRGLGRVDYCKFVPKGTPCFGMLLKNKCLPKEASEAGKQFADMVRKRYGRE